MMMKCERNSSRVLFLCRKRTFSRETSQIMRQTEHHRDGSCAQEQFVAEAVAVVLEEGALVELLLKKATRKLKEQSTETLMMMKVRLMPGQSVAEAANALLHLTKKQSHLSRRELVVEDVAENRQIQGAAIAMQQPTKKRNRQYEAVVVAEDESLLETRQLPMYRKLLPADLVDVLANRPDNFTLTHPSL